MDEIPNEIELERLLKSFALSAHRTTTRAALARHAALGEDNLLESCYHFLVTRVVYQASSSGHMSEEDLDALAAEAYVVFVESSLRSYHTWLAEIGVAPDNETFDHILYHAGLHWESLFDSLKSEMDSLGILR